MNQDAVCPLMMRARSFFPENRKKEGGSLFPVVIVIVVSLLLVLELPTTLKLKMEKNSKHHILHLENRTYQNVSGFNSRKILNMTNSLQGTETNQKEFSKKADQDSLNELSCSLGLSKQGIKDYPRLTVIVAREKIFSENEGDKQLKECATQFQTHTLSINSSFDFPGFMSCFINQSIFPLGLGEALAKGKKVLNQDCFFKSGSSFFEIKKMDENNNSTIATIKARCAGSIRGFENLEEAGLPTEITFKLDVIENEGKFQINQQTAQGECVLIDLNNIGYRMKKSVIFIQRENYT